VLFSPRKALFLLPDPLFSGAICSEQFVFQGVAGLAAIFAFGTGAGWVWVWPDAGSAELDRPEKCPRHNLVSAVAAATNLTKMAD